MNTAASGGIELFKKIRAGAPGSDDKGRSIPSATIQYAFGVTAASVRLAELTRADGFIDTSKLTGGVLTIVGANKVNLALAPGKYKLYEFVIVRDVDAVSLLYNQRAGWDLSAEVDGVSVAPDDADDGAILFEIGAQPRQVSIMAINKSVCVQIEKTYSSGSKNNEGVLFFGTSSYLGLTPDKFNWNGSAIVRLGVTDANGSVRLDGFVSGNNVFIHEVVPKAAYDAGVRPKSMTVHKLDGSISYTTGFPNFHQVAQDELDLLLNDPKFTAAGKELVRSRLHVGDYLFSNQEYFNEREGVLRVDVVNDDASKSKIELFKKIRAGAPGSDAAGRSDPASTIQYAFGVTAASVRLAEITRADGFIDTSKLVGGVLTVVGLDKVSLALSPGKYKLYEFVIVRDADAVSLVYKPRAGWDFSAEIDGVLTSPNDADDGAILFELGATPRAIAIMAINKSLCVQIVKLHSSGNMDNAGVLFFGTSSYLGLTPDKFNWNGSAIVRLGVTDANGKVRLDGFVTGNNVFIHEVVPKAAYDAGVRPKSMTVYNLNGSTRFTTGFPASHQVTQAELEQLLRDPKFTAAGRELIQSRLKVGDYLFGVEDYFNEREGVMRVEVLNENQPRT
ncbi:hypothetical protein [Caballeronia sordidicola]|uniref:Uncharacterized protein n=1 Tax=Caballeronia sordidicola TaxID=196367 RepID=A0A242N682_CABSO|nr:hypothetical protein [Caballeronia sordidicola]OTP79151.1 hypothetical protein PAMC26510_06715 [Caballeronia sordidicola]